MARYRLDLAAQVELPPAVAEPSACLAPTAVIESQTPELVDRARALTSGIAASPGQAHALLTFARDSIAYDLIRVFDSRRRVAVPSEMMSLIRAAAESSTK